MLNSLLLTLTLLPSSSLPQSSRLPQSFPEPKQEGISKTETCGQPDCPCGCNQGKPCSCSKPDNQGYYWYKGDNGWLYGWRYKKIQDQNFRLDIPIFRAPRRMMRSGSC